MQPRAKHEYIPLTTTGCESPQKIRYKGKQANTGIETHTERKRVSKLEKFGLLLLDLREGPHPVEKEKTIKLAEGFLPIISEIGLNSCNQTVYTVKEVSRMIDH